MIQGLFPGIRRYYGLENVGRSLIATRSIVASTTVWAKKMLDRPAPVSEDEFPKSFLKGNGPGGQKIVSLGFILSDNKTSSAMQLKHIPT